MKLLEGLSLEERQRLYYNGSHCPYCGAETDYVDSIEVYRESYGMIYICRPCQAWVNTHHQSQDQAFGFVAKKALRDLRHECHKWFDGLWDAKVKQLGTKRKQAQTQARAWLAGYLNIEIEACHIGMFDEDLCTRTIEKCKTLYPTAEQVAQREAAIQERKETVYSLAFDLDLEVKEFDINGKVQMEIKPKTGATFYFDPIRKLGRFANKKKPSDIEDIEEFITKHFKEKSDARK